MNIKITFRGMDHSDSIEAYAHKELESKVFKFITKEPEPINFDLILESHKEHSRHKVELRISSKHNHFIINHEGDDLYKEIDHVMKIAVIELKKSKSKFLDKRDQKPKMPDVPEDDE